MYRVSVLVFCYHAQCRLRFVILAFLDVAACATFFALLWHCAVIFLHPDEGRQVHLHASLLHLIRPRQRSVIRKKVYTYCLAHHKLITTAPDPQLPHKGSVPQRTCAYSYPPFVRLQHQLCYCLTLLARAAGRQVAQRA
jgi:hypothetical protein